MNYPPAKTIRIGDRLYISNLYSASQALDILLRIGEALRGPLSHLLGRKVAEGLDGVADALGALEDRQMSIGAMLGLFQGVRAVGGIELVVAILSTTSYRDRLIDSVARFDETFDGPGGLIEAARLLVEVAQYQASPLLAALRPLLSEGGTGAEGDAPKS